MQCNRLHASGRPPVGKDENTLERAVTFIVGALSAPRTTGTR
jgi:hypothetical protein